MTTEQKPTRQIERRVTGANAEKEAQKIFLSAYYRRLQKKMDQNEKRFNHIQTILKDEN